MHCALAVSVTTLEQVEVERHGAKQQARPRCGCAPDLSHLGYFDAALFAHYYSTTITSPIFFDLRRGAVRVCPSLITASRTLPFATSPGNAAAVRQAQLHPPPRRFSCPGMLDTGQTLQHHDEYKDDAR
jgi:hypothetical protein